MTTIMAGRMPTRHPLGPQLGPGPRGCLAALAVGLGAVGALLTALARPTGSMALDHVVTPAIILLCVFVVAESSQIHLELHRHTYSVSLSELPLVIGLFVLPPAWLLGVRLLAAVLVIAARRTAMLKAAFNVGLFTAEVGAAALLFHALAPGDGHEPRDWAVTYLVTLLTSSVATATVMVAMGFVQDRHTPLELLRVLPPVALAATINTTLGLLAVIVLALPAAGILLVVVLVLVMVVYRAYGKLLLQHADLGQLFTFTQRVGSARTSDDIVTQLLHQARELLQAEQATLRPLLPPSSWEQTGPRQLVGPLVIPRHTRDPILRSWLTRSGFRDALLVPLHDDHGPIAVLQVTDRMGAMGTFTDTDLELLQTLAAHAEVSWHNGRLLEQAQHDAQHDGLTDLANRGLFLLRLRQRLDACHGHRPGAAPAKTPHVPPDATPKAAEDATSPMAPTEAAVLLLDVDQLKEVNDTLGHHVGDLLLREVASRLQAHLSAEDTVARLGGDEFAVLLTRCSGPQEAGEVADWIRSVVSGPYEVAGTSIEVGLSVGVALVPTDGADPGLVLQHAASAMYAAQSSARGVVHYQRGDDYTSLRRLALAGELRRAIDSGEIVVHYQPKMSLSDGTAAGFEALARWNHPSRGLLAPDEFIPIAEQTGLITLLTRDVLQQALHQCRDWLPRWPGIGVAVNLSARGLLDPGLPATVARVLAETGVAPSLLTLEITESSVMEDFDTALEALNALRELGVRLSVDDFGTGYSSLAYLQRLPVHEVKIDKSFVIPMSVSPSAIAIVRAVIDLAHTLGLTVVAEGVEDELSRQALALMGCDIMQGYLLSRPLSVDQLRDWLRTQPALLELRGASPAP